MCDDLSFLVQAKQAVKRHESLNGARADSNAVGSADKLISSALPPSSRKTYAPLH